MCVTTAAAVERPEAKEGVDPVVRFRNPQDGEVVVDDRVRAGWFLRTLNSMI